MKNFLQDHGFIVQEKARFCRSFEHTPLVAPCCQDEGTAISPP